jgi:FKBP-type peptidyl-prolyl cis-trans isomerase
VTELVAGAGTQAVMGTPVTIHYTGRLADGRKFDSSRDLGPPVRFVLGRQMVIPGWEQGIYGMRVGGKRALVVPPHLAYGDHGRGAAIPPNATLFFEVELLGVH